MTSYNVGRRRRRTSYDHVRHRTTYILHFTSSNCVYVVRRRTWSYDVVRPLTLSQDAVRRQWMNDLYDVVLASSKYLYTFGKFSGHRNRQTRLDASGFTTCCIVEMTWVNMPDSYKNLRWTVPGPTNTSTEQFGHVLGLVKLYISRLPTVYTWQCTRRDARRHTTSYHVGRRRRPRTWSYNVVRSRGYFRMSTEQVGYVLGRVGPYISCQTVYVRFSARAGTHDVVQRHT